jgi:acetyl-CoA C-acetyltransferase
VTRTVIISAVRTPFGRLGGGLKDHAATELGAIAIRAALERSGLAGTEVDYVIMGQVLQAGAGQAPARQAAVGAGLPIEIPADTVNKVCASSIRAVEIADSMIRAGDVEVVVTGGMESMSNAPYALPKARFGYKMGDATLVDLMIWDGLRSTFDEQHMVQQAARVARELDISREAQDEWALRSHERAAKGQDAGAFDDEIVPVTVRDRKGNETVVTTDEHPRRDTTVERLSKLRPVMSRQDPEATVTAGNASGQNDAASACLVTTPEKAGELGLRPLGRMVSWAVAGVAPKTMGIGPVPAVAKALDRAGLRLADVDLIELNEAFASQVLACTREWKFSGQDFERLNVHGSGISLGHPVGATGGRILATLLRELDRRQARYGLETMCIGGGQGLAALFERA